MRGNAVSHVDIAPHLLAWIMHGKSSSMIEMCALHKMVYLLVCLIVNTQHRVSESYIISVVAYGMN